MNLFRMMLGRRAHVIPALLAVSAAAVSSAAGAREYTLAIDAQTPAAVGTAITFGVPFAQGDIAFDAPLFATFSVGTTITPVQVQVDRKASWCADSAYEFRPKNDCPAAQRSLRHAVVTAVLPVALQAAQRATLVLDTQGTSIEVRGQEATLPNDLAVQTRLTIDGQIWVAELEAGASELGGSFGAFGTRGVTGGDWLAGPLASERVVSVPFRSDSGSGAEHGELVARYGVRHHSSDGSTRVEVVVENVDIVGDVMRSYPYEVEVLINGKRRYAEQLIHFPHARWRVELWRESQPELHVIHDPHALMATGAVPNYDSNLVLNLDSTQTAMYRDFWAVNRPVERDGVLEFPGKEIQCYQDSTLRKTSPCTTAGAYELSVNAIGPMGVGDLPAWYMPQTGARDEIGPLPRWAATWILGQTYSSLRTMNAIADAAGSWPVHLRDPATGLPVSAEDHPDTELGVSRTGASGTIATCSFAVDCQWPYRPDGAHQASFAYLPYLVTGEQYYLEEVQFWASWNAMRLAPGWRGDGRGLVERQNQLRGAAWTLRNLSHAAFATPDAHALKSLYLAQLSANIAEYELIYRPNPENTNDFGAMGASGFPLASPWMDDYFTWSWGQLVDLGYDTAAPFAEWKSRYPVQRLGFGLDDPDDFCWIFAAQYILLLGPSDSVPASQDPTVATVTNIRGASTGATSSITMFKNIESVFRYSNKAKNGGYFLYNGAGLETAQACGSPEQGTELGLATGEMVGKSNRNDATLAHMGPAIAMAVDRGTEGGSAAWQRFWDRMPAPDYSTNPQWAVVPREQDPDLGSAIPNPPSGGGKCV